MLGAQTVKILLQQIGTSRTWSKVRPGPQMGQSDIDHVAFPNPDFMSTCPKALTTDAARQRVALLLRDKANDRRNHRSAARSCAVSKPPTPATTRPPLLRGRRGQGCREAGSQDGAHGAQASRTNPQVTCTRRGLAVPRLLALARFPFGDRLRSVQPVWVGSLIDLEPRLVRGFSLARGRFLSPFQPCAKARGSERHEKTAVTRRRHGMGSSSRR